MNRKLLIGIGITAAGFAVLNVWLLAALRLREARQFSQKHRIKTAAGTKYVMQLVETSVGKLETGSLVIVYARFENPNPSDLVLAREMFALAGQGRFLPVTNGTQVALIKLPANGVLDKEALSYAVGDDSFAGTLALEVGHSEIVLVKNGKPWTQRLPVGQFVTFHSRDW
jgi:hypothetical protein